MAQYFAVLDFGCKNISCIASHWARNGEYVLDVFNINPSSGIHKGIITDISLAADSISETISKLRKRLKKKIKNIYVSIDSSTVEIIPSQGTLLLSKYGREVSYQDVKKCIQIGSILKLPPGRTVLHRIVKGFSIDGQNGIKNPVGLEGIKLTVDMFIITIDSTLTSNLQKCISLSGAYLSGIIFSGIAVANRLLTEKDLEETVCILNICKDQTDAAIVNRGIIMQSKTFKLGSDDFSPSSNMIETSDKKNLSLLLQHLSSWTDVKRIIVTGDTYLKEEFIESLENSISCPIKSGVCLARAFENLPSKRTGYIGSLGMLDYLYNKRKNSKIEGNFLKRFFAGILKFLDEYF